MAHAVHSIQQELSVQVIKLLQLFPQKGILLILLNTSISIENMTPSYNTDVFVIPLQFQPLPKDQLSETQETTSLDSFSTMSDTEMDFICSRFRGDFNR